MNDSYLDVNWDNVLRYDPETIAIPAGGFLEVPGVASFVGFLSVTGSDNLQISFNGINYQPLEVGLLIKAPRNKGFRRLFIRNPGASSNTVRVSKGLGDFDDNRLVLVGTSVINTNPVPSAYAARKGVNSVAGSGLATLTVVAAGSNINGVLVLGGSLSCGADTIARAAIEDSAFSLLQAMDSQAFPINSPFTIPAGNALSILTVGLCRVSVLYRTL